MLHIQIQCLDSLMYSHSVLAVRITVAKMLMASTWNLIYFFLGGMAKPWLCVYVQCCCTGYSIENNLIPGAFNRMHDHAMTDHFFFNFVSTLLAAAAAAMLLLPLSFWDEKTARPLRPHHGPTHVCVLLPRLCLARPSLLRLPKILKSGKFCN